MITDAELLVYNQRGLIPGPNESEKSFLNRIESIKNAPFSLPGHPLEEKDWEGACHLTRRLFDIVPNWIPGFLSNKGLPFWQGAAAWISEDEMQLPLIQIKPGIRSNEVLAHEALHAVRMAYNESCFEEFFAYQTSSLKWKRWLGPIFRTSKESYVFIASLFVSMAYDAMQLFFNWPVFPTALIPLSLAAFGFARLFFTRRAFGRSRESLKKLVKRTDIVNAVLFRLTDQEIWLFSKMTKNDIQDYIQSQDSLRWRSILLAYF